MYDIFISYAQSDNVFPRYNHDGWIDWFHRALEARLTQIRGCPAKIWRDQTGGVAGNSVLHPAIEEALEQTKILVPVFSPAYLASQWCREELQMFRDAARRKFGLRVGTHSRIAHVLKLPVLAKAHIGEFAEIVDVRGYDFFERCSDGRPLELTPEGTNFYAKINSVAYDLSELLDTFEEKPVTQPVIASSGTTVYLAETSSDVAPQRDHLRYELRQFGHSVLPEIDRMYDRNYAARVQEDLKRSHFSVHLIGEDIGITPERSRESIIETQYLAALEEELERPAFARLCWMPPQIITSRSDDERHAALIARLLNDRCLYRGALEDFKGSIEKMLEKKNEPKPPMAPGAARSVYLIFEPLDADGAKRIEDWLYEEGFNPKTPLRDGTDSERRKLDRDYLKLSDAVLIFYGSTNEFWLKKRLNDLEKIAGYGRKRPFLARGVVLADPKTAYKERFRERDYIAIKGFDPFSPREMDSFACMLRSAAGRASIR